MIIKGEYQWWWWVTMSESVNDHKGWVSMMMMSDNEWVSLNERQWVSINSNNEWQWRSSNDYSELVSMRDTRWWRLIGCPKLQVIFEKEPLIIGLFCGTFTFVDITCKDTAFHGFSSPCTVWRIITIYHWVMSHIWMSVTYSIAHSYVWHDSCTCAMTYAYVPWLRLIQFCGMFETQRDSETGASGKSA